MIHLILVLLQTKSILIWSYSVQCSKIILNVTQKLLPWEFELDPFHVGGADNDIYMYIRFHEHLISLQSQFEVTN